MSHATQTRKLSLLFKHMARLACAVALVTVVEGEL
jgi:hypothetical protein